MKYDIVLCAPQRTIAGRSEYEARPLCSVYEDWPEVLNIGLACLWICLPLDLLALGLVPRVPMIPTIRLSQLQRLLDTGSSRLAPSPRPGKPEDDTGVFPLVAKAQSSPPPGLVARGTEQSAPQRNGRRGGATLQTEPGLKAGWRCARARSSSAVPWYLLVLSIRWLTNTTTGARVGKSVSVLLENWPTACETNKERPATHSGGLSSHDLPCFFGPFLT